MEGTYRPVRVRVNDELVLDAGCCVEGRRGKGAVHIIEPPPTTLFHQVVAYLDDKPDPVKPPSGSMVSREGVAAAAVTLRWGSYLAVLLDRDQPVWSEVGSPDTSRIYDGEMARINIEASAALAEWIDIYRAERGGRRYEQLVNRAVAYLPMPRKRTKLCVTEFLAFAQPELAAELVELADPVRRERARQDVGQHASRVFASALLNTAWRNGPVEGIHAGHFRGYPMDHRRMTPAEERELMAFACERLALGMTVCLKLATERPGRSWAEQVLPYGLADLFLITPSCWTLTESSREVRLPALDPASTDREVP
jgi:hypothetical protein